MSQIHIVVDSTAQIPGEMLATYKNLHIVPLKVRVGDREWQENEISTKELFSAVQANHSFPKTSQPAPGDFMAVLKPLVEAGKEIIFISVSGGLSGSVQGARSVAKMIDEKKIHVIDSGTTSIGMVQMTKAALEMVIEGKTAQEIVAKLDAIVKATHTLILIDTLEYLYKGGRIGGAAALFGTILQIRPVLYLVDGKVAVLDKVRTKQRAINRIFDEIQKYQNIEYIGVGDIDVPVEGESLRARLQERYPDTKILTANIGSVVAAHLGPGMIGFVVQEKI